MHNRKKLSRIVCFLILLVLATDALWYVWPRTAEELFPEFRWEDVAQVGGSYDYCVADEKPANAPDHYTGTVEAVDLSTPEGQEILSLLQRVKYRRTLGNLLPSGTRYYGPLRPGDFQTEVVFSTTDATLTVEYWWDEIQISFRHNPEYICKVDGEEELASRMLQWLRSHSAGESPF